MKELPPTAYVIILYTIVMALGLYVGSDIIHKIYVTGELPPAVANPDAPESSASIFIYILLMTGLLLILLKLKLDFIIKIVSILAILGGMTVTLAVLLGDAGLIAAIAILALAAWKKQNLMLFNLTLVLTVAGAGAFLGASLSILPSTILLIVLSVYDLIAVFWTKHMVTLAEKAKGKLPFMFIIPHKGRTFGLGTGDMAIPLVFTVSVLKDYTITNALATAAGGLVGLLTLFLYIQKRKKITLPALPPLALGLLAGFAASLLPSIL